MRRGFGWASLLGLLLASGACSLLVEPTIDDLPCGEGDLCREGYVCIDAVCVKGDGAPSGGGDGGSGAGGDGGGGDGGGNITEPCGGACPDGQRCDEVVNRCVATNDCSTKRCAAGQSCSAGNCVAIAAGASGASCTSDGECTAGVCLKSAIGPGVCAAPCANDAACAGGEECLFPFNGRSGYCVPTSFPACARDADCAAVQAGLVCTLWDFGGALFPACTSATGGAQVGSGCGSGLDCRTGLCASNVCTAPCLDGGDCVVAGDSCEWVTTTVNTAAGEALLCSSGTAGGLLAAGACCEFNEDCLSGSCAQDAGRAFNYCLDDSFCAGDGDCAASGFGWTCHTQVGVCQPASCTR